MSGLHTLAASAAQKACQRCIQARDVYTSCIAVKPDRIVSHMPVSSEALLQP